VVAKFNPNNPDTQFEIPEITSPLPLSAIATGTIDKATTKKSPIAKNLDNCTKPLQNNNPLGSINIFAQPAGKLKICPTKRVRLFFSFCFT